MFFNEKKIENFEEAPLGYWEEKSYMVILPENNKVDLSDGIFERVSKIEGVEIKEKRALTEQDTGMIKIIYENEEYEIGFYPTDFSFPENYVKGPFIFSNEEVEMFRIINNVLVIFMKFNDDSRKSFHLQLKIAIAMMPNFVGIMDESAERMLPKKLIKMIVNSKIGPSTDNLYTVQAISDKNGEVWLHTHGLCRCGLTELEILQSDVKNYNNHYNILSTYATYLLDKKSEINLQEQSVNIGMLVNREPIVATSISWTKGLKEYDKKLTLGTIEDRQDGHNSKTNIIFIYKCEEDEINKKYSKVKEINDLLGRNPVFFISTEETARMKALAQERFGYLKNESVKKENRIIIKIALPTVDNDFEHIWFELVEFDGERFKAKLTQEPYNVKDFYLGSEAWFTVEDVTDWVIYTPKFSVTPNKAYLLT